MIFLHVSRWIPLFIQQTLFAPRHGLQPVRRVPGEVCSGRGAYRAARELLRAGPACGEPCGASKGAGEASVTQQTGRGPGSFQVALCSLSGVAEKKEVLVLAFLKTLCPEDPLNHIFTPAVFPSIYPPI